MKISIRKVCYVGKLSISFEADYELSMSDLEAVHVSDLCDYVFKAGDGIGKDLAERFPDGYCVCDECEETIDAKHMESHLTLHEVEKHGHD